MKQHSLHHKKAQHHMKKAEHHHEQAAKHHEHAKKHMAKVGSVPASKMQHKGHKKGR